MKKLFYLLTVITAVSLLSCGNDDADRPAISYENAEQFFTDLNFQGAVIIQKNGAEVLSRGFGLANQQTAEANSIETKFRLASVSKTLTAMGVVQLKRDGLIESFDQKLSDFDEEFPHGTQISIRHLLTHQSGLPEYVGAFEPLAKSGEQFEPEDIYEIIKESVTEDGLLFAPGERFHYCNSNFLIAALLIEELSGVTYAEYIQDKVLNPLGMTHTEIGTNVITLEGYAHGYQGNADRSEYPIEITLGAGNWTSTASDMLNWCEAVMGDWFTDEEKAEIFPGEVPAETTLMGMGWFKSNIGGKVYFWHGGDIDGFSTMIGFIPEVQGIIITLSNQEDVTGSQREQLIETLLRQAF